MFRESFYHFLMTLRQPNQPTEIEQFANNAFLDSSFPKQSQDFDEISHIWKKMLNIARNDDF